MVYKMVGADQSGKFPPRVETAISAKIATEVSTDGKAAKEALDGIFAPISGSANYAPASGSANYAPAAGSTKYASLDSTGKVPAAQLVAAFVSPKEYGAKGDGVADDTTFLQNWLNAGGSVISNGTYRITAGLTISAANRTLITDNAKILADGVGIRALTVSGNNATIRVNIDGNNKAYMGVYITGSGVLVERSVIENMSAAADGVRGVEVVSAGGCIIRNNVIRNLYSAGDATLGNNVGTARAIILSASTAATARSVISGNVIDNITGEEGDAIQVLFTGYASGKTTIADNKISNVSRRFIKIQAADCQVLRNTLSHDGVVPANPGNAIDIISASNITVEGNDIYPHPLLVSISCSGVSGTPISNLVIKNNIIRQADDKNAFSLYCTYVNESIVQDNVFYGGSYAVSISNCIGFSIGNNTHYGGITANPSFSANATCTGVVMRNNVNMAAARTTTVSNTSTTPLTEYNAKRP